MILDYCTANEWLRLDRETGLLYWRKARGSRAAAGAEAGYIGVKGYNTIGFRGKIYYAHRLCWLLYYGSWPKQLDHINGKKADNRRHNLREADQAENRKNCRIRDDNTSGHMGVSWSKASSVWKAYINVDRERRHLGCFTDFDEAVTARAAAEVEHGYHANHGRAE